MHICAITSSANHRRYAIERATATRLEYELLFNPVIPAVSRPVATVEYCLVDAIARVLRGASLVIVT